MQVNYILKEAYIAIPFSIKPSNITSIMGQNFKFKKGVLFQVSTNIIDPDDGKDE